MIQVDPMDKKEAIKYITENLKAVILFVDLKIEEVCEHLDNVLFPEDFKIEPRQESYKSFHSKNSEFDSMMNSQDNNIYTYETFKTRDVYKEDSVDMNLNMSNSYNMDTSIKSKKYSLLDDNVKISGSDQFKSSYSDKVPFKSNEFNKNEFDKNNTNKSDNPDVNYYNQINNEDLIETRKSNDSDKNHYERSPTLAFETTDQYGLGLYETTLNSPKSKNENHIFSVVPQSNRSHNNNKVSTNFYVNKSDDNKRYSINKSEEINANVINQEIQSDHYVSNDGSDIDEESLHENKSVNISMDQEQESEASMIYQNDKNIDKKQSENFKNEYNITLDLNKLNKNESVSVDVEDEESIEAEDVDLLLQNPGLEGDANSEDDSDDEFLKKIKDMKATLK